LTGERGHPARTGRHLANRLCDRGSAFVTLPPPFGFGTTDRRDLPPLDYGTAGRTARMSQIFRVNCSLPVLVARGDRGGCFAGKNCRGRRLACKTCTNRRKL